MCAFVFLCVALAPGSSAASCAWARLDRTWSSNTSGPWNSNVYRGLAGAVLVADVAGAVWEGADSRLGRTLWQGVDSTLVSAAAGEIGKRVFTRARPGVGADPCMWFQGDSNHSFPSGEAAVAAGLVTPFMLEYGRENPAAYALALLPLYVGAGRIRNQSHWQSDVLAGWAIGGVSGWYAHGRDTPFTLMLLPRGVALGIRKRF